MTFKEQQRADNGCVFFNPAEFGETHTVNGKKMWVIMDDNELSERKKRAQSHMDGMYKKQMLIYVSALEFGPLPGIGKPCTIDGVTFTIADSLNEGGVYSLHLEANVH